MSTQLSTFVCVCLALVIPLMVVATSNHHAQEEMIASVSDDGDRQELHHRGQQPLHSLVQDDASSEQDHFVLKKAADFEQILKPCNRMPASGRGQEYADCVRSRMLLMGRRKRRQAA